MWCPLRTPEQFAQWYQIFVQVATQASASIVSELNVPGLATFKKGYTQPQLQLQIQDLTLLLQGSRRDLYPLLPFIEDPAFFGFEIEVDGGYKLELEAAEIVKETVEDLKDMCNTWGWLLDVQ